MLHVPDRADVRIAAGEAGEAERQMMGSWLFRRVTAARSLWRGIYWRRGGQHISDISWVADTGKRWCQGNGGPLLPIWHDDGREVIGRDVWMVMEIGWSSSIVAS